MKNDTVRELSVGQALEIQDACRRQEVSLSEIKMLTSGNNLRRSIDWLNGIVPVLNPFNPTTFIGKGWEVVGGRKLLHEGFDPAKLRVVSTPLKKGESSITGDEAKERLIDQSLAGVEAFWRCWNDRDNLPKELRGKIILFDGDELRDPGGDRYSLCLDWVGGRWGWDCYWLDDVRGAGCVSALAS